MTFRGNQGQELIHQVICHVFSLTTSHILGRTWPTKKFNKFQSTQDITEDHLQDVTFVTWTDISSLSAGNSKENN